jgi:hypothetical protein
MYSKCIERARSSPPMRTDQLLLSCEMSVTRAHGFSALLTLESQSDLRYGHPKAEMICGTNPIDRLIDELIAADGFLDKCDVKVACVWLPVKMMLHETSLCTGTRRSVCIDVNVHSRSQRLMKGMARLNLSHVFPHIWSVLNSLHWDDCDSLQMLSGLRRSFPWTYPRGVEQHFDRRILVCEIRWGWLE